MLIRLFLHMMKFWLMYAVGNSAHRLIIDENFTCYYSWPIWAMWLTVTKCCVQTLKYAITVHCCVNLWLPLSLMTCISRQARLTVSVHSPPVWRNMWSPLTAPTWRMSGTDLYCYTWPPPAPQSCRWRRAGTAPEYRSADPGDPMMPGYGCCRGQWGVGGWRRSGGAVLYCRWQGHCLYSRPGYTPSARTCNP